MNTFSCKILMENQDNINYNSMANLVVKEKGFLEQILEFDEVTSIAQVEMSRKFYKSLLESDIIVNEGVLASIADFIKTVIDAIVGFFKSLFGGGSSSSSSDDKESKPAINRMIESTKKEYDKFLKLYPVFTKNIGRVSKDAVETVIPYTYIAATFVEFDTAFDQKNSRDLVAKVNSLLMSTNANNVEEVSKTLKEHTEAMKKENENILSIRQEFLDNTAELNNPEEKETPIRSFLFMKGNTFKEPKMRYAGTLNFEDQSKTIKNNINNLETLEKTITKQINNANVAADIRAFIVAYQAYTVNAIKYYGLRLQRFYSIFLKDLKQTNYYLAKYSGKFSKHEAYITEYDDSLSAALDEACLLAEFEYRQSLLEIEYTRIAEEAMIFSSDKSYTQKLNELAILNEGIANKIKRAFYIIIEKIRTIFTKFMEKLNANFTTTKHYLDKYKKIILSQTWVARNYKTKDIINGMNRTLTLDVPNLNYGSIQDKLNDPVVFFKSQIDMKMGSKFNGEAGDIATYCKDWFTGPETTYTAKQIQDNIKDIYDYMYDIRKIEQSIKKSIESIKTNCENAVKQAGIDINNTPAPASQQANTESYYSTIYGRVLNEVEKEDTGAPSGDQPGNGAPNNPSMTGKVASAAKNVGDQDKEDTAYKTSEKPIVEKQCEVYAKVCTDVLKAKLTAVEYIRSEFMQIIRWHVEDYIGKETNKRNDAAYNTGNLPQPPKK